MRVLMALLLLTSAAWAVRVDLTGEWRYRAGNEANGSQPELDDSSWTRVRLPRQAGHPERGGWFRRRVTVPPEAEGKPLVLTIGTFADLYEVWWNGVRIGSSGLTTREAGAARPRLFPVPAELVTAARPAVVALRAVRIGGAGPFFHTLNAFPDSGPYLLTDEAGAPADAPALAIRNRERMATSVVVTSAIEMLLALMLFITWFTETERRSLPWLGTLLMLSCARGLIGWLVVSQDLPLSTIRSIAYMNGISQGVLGMFALSVFGIRSRWAWVAVWSPVALFDMTYTWAGDVLSTPLWAKLPRLVFLLLLAGLAVHRARKNFLEHGTKSGKGWIPLAIATLALIQTQWIPDFVIGRQYWVTGGYAFPLYDGIMIGLASGMTLYALLTSGEDRRERERLAAEIEAGRTIQQMLLAPPDSGGPFACEAVYLPALEVGGDFYWTRALPDGSLVVLVGDVSGKGLKAAMLVSVAIGILRNEESAEPAAILDRLNRGLAGHTAGGFVTACCVRLHPGGTATVASAGHPLPYVDGRELAAAAGLPLGVSAAQVYEEATVSGARFAFVSDGVVEAANASGELFGFDRTREISMKSASEIAEAAKQWGQNDDITVVTVRRNVR